MATEILYCFRRVCATDTSIGLDDNKAKQNQGHTQLLSPLEITSKDQPESNSRRLLETIEQMHLRRQLDWIRFQIPPLPKKNLPRTEKVAANWSM